MNQERHTVGGERVGDATRSRPLHATRATAARSSCCACFSESRSRSPACKSSPIRASSPRATPDHFVISCLLRIATSPLHHLLDPALHAPTVFAVVIACGELAAGLGTLVGVLSRVAACAGMLLSLLFFLTVSFNDSPYYYGADIVFLFAWTPIAIGGAGPLSFDEAFSKRHSGSSRSRTSATNRLAVRAASAIGIFAGFAVLLGASVRRSGTRLPPNGYMDLGPPPPPPPPRIAAAHQPKARTRTTSSVRRAVSRLVRLAFTDKTRGIPGFVVQPTPGAFRAFSAICTHAGCTVQFEEGSRTFACPCHGSIFNANTGAVIRGPAVAPLPEIGIRTSSGELYLTN